MIIDGSLARGRDRLDRIAEFLLCRELDGHRIVGVFRDDRGDAERTRGDWSAPMH